MKTLIVIPVYNEAMFITRVLEEVLLHRHDVLVVDDGSNDGSERMLEGIAGVRVLRHPVNLGYGQSLIDAFDYASANDYDVVVTLDADGQHEPAYVPMFLAELASADIVSGSRYLKRFDGHWVPPPDRRRINRVVTQELEKCFGLTLTDAFCGFKAYRVDALVRMRLTEPGYAMPLQLWAQAAHLGLRIVEVPVQLIYYPCLARSFGGTLDKPEVRLRYYRDVLRKARRNLVCQTSPEVPGSRLAELCACCGTSGDAGCFCRQWE